MSSRDLEGLKIGISISEVPDIGKLGYGHVHLRSAMIEIARYLLSNGAALVYGGDLRYNPNYNFVTVLFDLVRNYNYSNQTPAAKIFNYMPYPINQTIDDDERADLIDVATFIDDIYPPKKYMGKTKNLFQSTKPEDTFTWALSLSLLRERMNNDIDARIFIGGKTRGYKGKYPGLIEEAYLALKSEKPVYLIGTYGGCSEVLINAITNRKPEELSEEYQFVDKKYKTFVDYYNDHLQETPDQEPIDYNQLNMYFSKFTIKGLNNGLTPTENQELFYLNEPRRMARMIIKGLKKISQ